MKRIIYSIIFAMLASAFLIGCAQRTVVAQDVEDPNSSSKIEEVEKVSEDITVETPTKEPEKIINFEEINNSEILAEYLESKFDGLTFTVRDKFVDYFDDYYSIQLQESSYISGINADSFEVVTIGVAFNDNKIIDLSISVNVKPEDSFKNYEKDIEEIAFMWGVDNQLTERDLVDLEEKFTDFPRYENNIYGNKETYLNLSDNLFVAVIFEGGKDFEFEGTTYFFVMTSMI